MTAGKARPVVGAADQRAGFDWMTPGTCDRLGARHRDVAIVDIVIESSGAAGDREARSQPGDNNDRAQRDRSPHPPSHQYTPDIISRSDL